MRTLAYERVGAGPPLVLLHGIGHRRQAWYPVLDRLIEHREVVLVDLPGHGESPPLEVTNRTVTDVLRDALINLLDHLDLDRPHLAGNSLGGRVALELALDGRARSVTAMSPAGFWRTNSGQSYPKAVFGLMRGLGRMIRPVAPKLAGTTAGRAVMYAAIVARPSRLGAEQAFADLEAFLASSSALRTIMDGSSVFRRQLPDDVPVTIAWGTRDALLLPYQAKVARKVLANARHVALPGCGHVPMTDDPERVATVLIQGSAS
jgi:pimeloyl-ACP methyl ester carboxylesterase